MVSNRSSARVEKKLYAPTRRSVVVSLLAFPLAACNEDLGGTYPSRNISFIIPSEGGGGMDAIVRVICSALERFLPNKVHVIPLNVAAGGGGKGISQLYRADPDGHTIGIVNIPGAFLLQKRQGATAYDLNKFSWIGKVGRSDHYALGVAWDSPFRSIEDLRQASEKRPIKFTSVGPEGTGYAATMIITRSLGIRARIITGYKGANDYIIATVRGDGDAVVASTSNLIPMASGKHLRILATLESVGTIPGVPDAKALGNPELSQINVQRLVCGPPGLPREIVNVLSTALNNVADDPETRVLAERLYAPLAHDTPEHAAAIVREQGQLFQKWKTYL